MDYLFNLFLLSWRPIAAILVLWGLSYFIPLFIHRGPSNKTYLKYAKWRVKVAVAAIVAILLLYAGSPTITPQNSVERELVTVPVDIPKQEITSRMPKDDEAARGKRFEEITDWRKSNGTTPAE